MDKPLFDKIVDEASRSFPALDKKTIVKIKKYLSEDLHQRELSAAELKKAAKDILKNED